MGTWVLTDLDHDTWVESLDLTDAQLDLPSGSNVRISKRRLRGGVRDGIDLLCVNNGTFSLNLLPTRGMGIWDGHYRGTRIGWQSPVRGPVHPAYVFAAERGGQGWLNGFDECICRCGLASNGPPCEDHWTDSDGRSRDAALTLHGRIANLPASRVTVSVDPSTGAITVEGVVEECGLFDARLRLTTRLSSVVGANAWTLVDEVLNIGGHEATSQLLYHCNFGAPFLNAGARLRLPVKRVVPRDAATATAKAPWDVYSPPRPGSNESCYFIEPLPDSRGWVPALLRDADARLGVEIGFDAQRLPCFTVWKHCAAEADGYVTGLEPATNYPNPRPFERTQGRVRRLAPGDAYRATLSLTVWDNPADVVAAEQRIDALQASQKPEIHSRPIPGLCPEASAP